MGMRIAINGFGRIGRCVLRAIIEQNRSDIDVVAINDIAPIETSAHLLQFDSVHGRLNADVSLNGNVLQINERSIRFSAERDPAQLPWNDVDIALECTGLFRKHAQAAQHLNNGSRRVLISAPGKDVEKTIVYGVNHTILTKDDLVVSNASCTTNCLAPVAKLLDDSFGIETGFMTTIHSYTGDQPTHDRHHRDLHRGRAAALSMVPTTTGAAKAVVSVLPQLEGRLNGSAVRVPTPNVSAIDLTFMPKRAATADQVNALFSDAAAGPMKGVLAVESRPLVSIDFNHNPHSSIIALDQTRVTQGGMVRVFGWYDNEWGFSCRMLDTATHMASLTS